MVEDLIQKTLEITKAAVRDANLRINQVDEVILVGGQTRMPRVREAIGSLFQKEPSRTVHPEEVVAIGAAVHANALTAAPAAGTAHAVLLDVTPFDLGIDIVGGKFEPIIKRNSQVPTQATKTFYTNKDGQDSVKVTVRQGERGAAADNEFLGEFVMTGLTPAARMQTKVEVTFRLDMNGMLHVAAVEPGSGEKKRITIRNYAEFAKGGVGVEVEGDVQPVAAAPASEAPRQGGLLSRLFGGGKKKDAPAAPPAARAPTVAPEPAVTLSAAPSPAVSAPAGVDLEPLGLGMSPGLDLGPLTMEDVGEAWPEPPAALDLPLDAADIIEDLPLSEADVLEELGASPGAAEAAAPTAPRSAAPVAADPFAGDPFGDDPFEADPFDADPFGAAPSVEPAGGPTGTSAGEGAPEAFAFEEEDEAPPVAPTAAAAGGGLSWGDDDPFGDLPAAPLHDPFTARPKDDEPESFALPDDEEEHEIDALDALDAFDAADPTPTLGLTETPTGPGTAGVDDFLSSLTDVDDDLKAMLDALEEPAPSPARGALPGFAPFTAPTGASPQARTDIFDRGALSLSDFEDEDSDIELITSASVDQRPAVTADADAPIATGGADDGDVDYDDIPDDDLVQFSRQGGAHSEVTEASFGLSLDEEEDADDEATDPGPSRAGAARLRVEYRRHDAMLREYRENLSKNGCFIKTGAPLRLGRSCLIEVRAPGLRKPLVIPGVVSWTSQGMARLPPDQAAGMGITWQLDQAQRGELERILRT
jgi:Tfp pilus assembly protein PilZ